MMFLITIHATATATLSQELLSLKALLRLDHLCIHVNQLILMLAVIIDKRHDEISTDALAW